MLVCVWEYLVLPLVLATAYQFQRAALPADTIQGHGPVAAQQQQVCLGQRVKLQVAGHSCLVQLHCTHHLQLWKGTAAGTL